MSPRLRWIIGSLITWAPTMSALAASYSGESNLIDLSVQYRSVFFAGESNLFALPVTKLSQTIAFTGPPDQPFSFTPVPLSATATSGLPVGFEVVAGPATRSGASLTLNGTGLITVRASQPGDANYLPAFDVERSFSVLANVDSWRQSRFSPSELADPARSGPTAVYGQDGLPNLVKYALGLEPKVNITSGLPSMTMVGSEWHFTYTRPGSVTDVTCTVEVSTNLTTWTETGVTLEPVSSVGGIDTWRARYPIGSAPNAFFRLKVTQP